MRKILLINPRSNKKESQRYRIEFPLKLLYLATILKNNSFLVKIFDFFIDFNIDLEKEIKKEDPFMVIICCNTKNLLDAINIADVIKKNNDKIKIVMEGLHSINFPEQVVMDKSFDVALLGEAETIIVDLAKKILNKESLINIPGIAFLDNNKIIKNKQISSINMDDLPFIDYSLIDMDKYLYRSVSFINGDDSLKKVFRFSFSRGCPFNCSFCQYKTYAYRTMSLQRMRKEIDIIVELFNPDLLYLEDATFFYKKDLVVDFLDYIKEKGYRFKIICTTRLNFFNENYITSNFVDRYKDLIFIWDFGVENCDKDVLKSINKNIDVDNLSYAIEIIKKENVKLGLSFMIGLPEENIYHYFKNMNFIRKIKEQYHNVLITYQFYQPLGKNIESEKAISFGYSFPRSLRSWDAQIDKNVGTISPFCLPWINVDAIEYLMLFCEFCINDFNNKNIKRLFTSKFLLLSWTIRNIFNFYKFLNIDLFFVKVMGFYIFNRVIVDNKKGIQ